jgi:GxxExxY protein
MNTDKHGLRGFDTTEKIIGEFYSVYNELGPGFLESVYVEALRIALVQAGLSVEKECAVTVRFRGVAVGRFRADLVIENAILVEAKACPKLHPQHVAQTLNYLRATFIEIALLLNFGSRPQFRRLLFDNQRKSLFSGTSQNILA